MNWGRRWGGNQSLPASLLALHPEAQDPPAMKSFRVKHYNSRVSTLISPPAPATTSIFTQQIYPWVAPSPRTRGRNEFIRGLMGREVSTVDTARGSPSVFQANHALFLEWFSISLMSPREMGVCREGSHIKKPDWQQVLKDGQDLPVACNQLLLGQDTNMTLLTCTE